MFEKYNPESKKSILYSHWENKKYFSPNYKFKKKYCITIPPPNITGNLHMGHAFQCTLMDILIRYKRMTEYSTLWKMGTDHAGIATQMLIEQNLKITTVKKENIDIKALYKYADNWKKHSIENINNQLKTLGCSLNWKSQRFTLDKNFSKAVTTAFIKLYEEKLIYKSNKIVNWDPTLKTAISDLETIYKKETVPLYYIKYKFSNNISEYLTIATTRPETIFGDVCIAINPKDNRYKNLTNKTVVIPIVNKNIPIIEDDDININFGTGCVKITPAHDYKDFEIGKKHNLKIINILTHDAKLNNNSPQKYNNLTVTEARKLVVEDLQKLNLIEKMEDYECNIPRGDRSNSIIEPLVTEQWYVKVKPLIIPVKEAIEKKKIKIYPYKWKKVFLTWIDNIKDWCISRQIWWGHKIPIWYDLNNNMYTGENEISIRKKYKLKNTLKLNQDKDILDTWFSSALWPFASLGWPYKTKELSNFYPTDILITGFDIIFFWAIRMIMFGIKFTNQIPFKEIYIHGLIRDNQGNKMSKTKGNVLDPLDIINGINYEDLINKRTLNLMQPQIKKQIIDSTKNQFPQGIESYGADALRFTFCSIATDNISIKLDFKKIKSYKNFCNKLWNAGIYLKLNNDNYKKYKTKNKLSIFDKWITSNWERTKETILINIKRKNFILLSETLYKFVWDEYCNWYIEFTKVLLKNKFYKNQTKKTLNNIFREILKTLHPIMPYITEEIWQTINIKKNNNFNSIMVEKFPSLNKSLINKTSEKIIIFLKNMSTIIRKIKKDNINKDLSNNILIENINKTNINYLENIKPLLLKLFNFKYINIKVENKQIENTIVNTINEIKIITFKRTVKKNTLSNTNIIKQNKIEQNIENIKSTLNNKFFLQKANNTIILEKKLKLKKFIEELKKYTDPT
ncbi:MAG TPA: valine--tRNA ligase [Candidatus Azoamicus sp. OHIO1]